MSSKNLDKKDPMNDSSMPMNINIGDEDEFDDDLDINDDDGNNGNDGDHVSVRSKEKKKKPPIKVRLKKMGVKMWEGIPSEFKSWKRWLAFVISMTAIFVGLAFIPTSTERLVTEDNPNPVVNWYSMVPPVLTIGFAVCFQQVLVALIMGIFVGGMIHFEGNVYHVFVYLIFQQIWDPFNAYVVGFTLTLVGMVYVMHKSGGLNGMCFYIAKLAKTTYSTRIVTAFAGIVFFFDDYGNTVVVGSTFRGLTDSMQISREKLAYLVDSTAAPVAGVAIISTWIGAELTYFQDVIDELGIQNMSAYDMFLACLPTRFYCYTALFLVFTCQITRRDYGPMLKAEKRALLEGKLFADNAKIGKDVSAENAPPDDIPKRWEYAVIPLMVVLLGSLFGMFWNGRQAVYDAGESLDIFNSTAWRLAIGSCDSAFVLFWSAAVATVFAFFMPIYGNTITFDQASRSFLSCIPSMYQAIILLVLAWGIKATCSYMETANFLVAILGDIPLKILPLLTFIMAAATALAIGSSWSTMGILLPIMMNLAWQLGEKDPSTNTGLESHSETIFFLTGSAVLDGAILGDHCSPISDTTVLSSVTTACDHMAHVATQMPYALTGGFLAGLYGYFAVGFMMPFYVFYPLCIATGFGIFFLFGTRLPDAQDVEKNPNAVDDYKDLRSPFGTFINKISGGKFM